MSDPYKPVQAGDELNISARAWNNVIKLPGVVAALQQTIGAGSQQTTRDPAVVLVKNMTEDTVPAFGVLAIGDPVFDPDVDNPTAWLQRVAFKGETPDLSDHFGRFAILLESCPADAVRRAVLEGVAFAHVRFPEQAEGEEPFHFADLESGTENVTERLRAAHAGAAEILYPRDLTTATPIEEDGDVYWAIVRLGRRPVPQYYAELTEDLEYGNNDGAGAEADLMYQVSDEGEGDHGSVASTGTTCRVFCPLLNEGKKLASGVRVKVTPSAQSGLFNADDARGCEEDI